jgi:hypothetical protein
VRGDVEYGLEPIEIVRFRSVHERGQVTLTAELSARPSAGWALLSDAGFDRYQSGFGERPVLAGSSVVVATTSRGLAASQEALRAVVAATNQRWHETMATPARVFC